MALENVFGNLLVYKELEPGTFQHVDQLTTQRRTNHGLRDQWFYTADGELYTVQNKGHLWAITREPQNLVLQNIDEAYRQLTDKAYRQLTDQGNYFPETEAGRASLEHADTVVVDLKGLKLVKDNDQYGHFVVDPKKVKKLNSERRRAAQRIYGPDEDNFGLNLEMFAEAGKTPYVFVLMPDYVQSTLRSHDKEFLGRASRLNSFNGDSYFCAYRRYVLNHYALRGVRRVIAAGDAPENKVPSILPETIDQRIELVQQYLNLHPNLRLETASRELTKNSEDLIAALNNLDLVENLISALNQRRRELKEIRNDDYGSERFSMLEMD